MSDAKRDSNRVTTLIGVSSVDSVTPTLVNVNPATGAVIVEGGSGGTEYTDAGTPPANPVGNTIEWDEGGTWRTVSTAKPLPVTASIDTTGLATTTTDTNTGTIAGDTTSIDGKTPALGQALAASSVPVVLTAAQITTLTPPAAITGFATSAKQPALGTAGTASSDVLTVQGIASMTPVTVDLGANNDITLATLPDTASGDLAAQTTDLAAIEVLLGTIDSDTGTIADAIKAEDSFTSDGHSGIGILAVRYDSGGNLVSNEFDYSFLQVDANGKLRVTAELPANSGVDIGDVTINNASGSPVYVREDQSGVISEYVTNTDGAATALSVFTTGASTYNYICAISVYNSSATDGFVIFTDGSGGTTKWFMPLPAGGGATIASDRPLFKSTANTAIYFDVSGAISTIYISVSGYRSTT